jgi:hypothetical protein
MDEDALYGLPLEEFTRERDELAKSLRKEGDRDGAARVKALRKPTVAAWAVNQVARTQPKTIRELGDAGSALRDAQSAILAGKGDAADLRAATERERAAVDELMQAARGLLSSSGAGLSESVLQDVEDSLHAAAIDDDARDAVLAGRLERERKAAGLGGELGAFAATAEPAPSRAQPRKTQEAPKREKKPTAEEKAATARAEAERKEEIRAARAAAREAAAEAKRAERQHELAESRLGQAEEALEKAKSARDEARDAVREARRLRDETAKEAKRLRAAAEKLDR